MANYTNLNISMVCGDTESFGFLVEGVDSLDEVFFSCKRNSQAQEYLFQKQLGSGINVDSPGHYVVRIAPGDTALLDPGNYWYDLEITVNNDVFTIYRGVLTLLPRITVGASDSDARWGHITGDLENQTDLYTELQNKVNSSNLIDLIYPIGSYYWSSESTNPNTIFGVGTWTQVKDKFMLAAGDTYTAGATGGEATHTLTINEMPEHAHKTCSASGYWAYCSEDEGYSTTVGPASGTGRRREMYFLDTAERGKSYAHNNMPPYIVAYCWHRDA